MLEQISLKEIIDQAQGMQMQGMHDQAMHLINQVIGQHPDNPYLIYVYATSLMHKGEFGIASVLLHNAVRVHPEFAEAYNNLAVCYRREYHLDWSIEACKKALEFRKDWADPYNNLAACYVNEGNPEEGLQYSDKALELNQPGTKEYSKVVWNRALMLLEMGRFKEGFDLYEAGLECGERPVRNYSEDPEKPTPYLDSIYKLRADHTVVVYGEQGMGDEIMFLAFLQNLIDTGAKIILDCHPRMTSLFHRSFPDIEIHGTRKRDKLAWPVDMSIDFCVSIASLAKLYLQNHSSFPQRAYIKPATEIARSMRRDIHNDGRRVIGIAWSGGTKKTNNLYRSLAQEQIELIAGQTGYKFVSLQYDNDGYMPDNVEPSWNITQHYNYDLTACLVEACDAVVAINTSVVHLAGAMGKRVFCLTPSKPAWRYGLDRKDMPLYPDVHQYRQHGDDWDPAIHELLRDLDIWSNLMPAEVVAL